MRFGVEDDPIEFECLGWSEQKIKIFEGLSEEEALHRVGLLFRHDALQPRVAFVRAAVFHEITEHHLAHLLIVFGIELF